MPWERLLGAHLPLCGASNLLQTPSEDQPRAAAGSVTSGGKLTHPNHAVFHGAKSCPEDQLPFELPINLTQAGQSPKANTPQFIFLASTTAGLNSPEKYWK